MGTKAMRVRVSGGERSEGRELCIRMVRLKPGERVSVWGELQTAPPRNFLQWLAIGGFCHLRNWRSFVNSSGAMNKWRQGSSSADCRIEVSDEFSSDANWRRRALDPCPAKEIRTGPEGFFAWLSRLAGLEDSARSPAPQRGRDGLYRFVQHDRLGRDVGGLFH